MGKIWNEKLPKVLKAEIGKNGVSSSLKIYPKLPAPLNLPFMFNWGYDRKWVKGVIIPEGAGGGLFGVVEVSCFWGRI